MPFLVFSGKGIRKGIRNESTDAFLHSVEQESRPSGPGGRAGYVPLRRIFFANERPMVLEEPLVNNSGLDKDYPLRHFQ